jgi:hypothetical protein
MLLTHQMMCCMEIPLYNNLFLQDFVRIFVLIPKSNAEILISSIFVSPKK